MKITFQDFQEQGGEAASLSEQIAANRFVHAALFLGEEGSGKKTLATLAAQAMLCRAEGVRPCGICRDCVMTEKLEHPDLIVVSRTRSLTENTEQKARTSISVDDIRELIRQCGLRTLDSGKRVVIIQDADRMTPQAQNCLLKTLEEPPENTFFLLLAEHPEALLSTVVSRCRPIRLHPWSDGTVRRALLAAGVPAERAEEILPAAAGSIGKALRLSGDEEYWKLREEVTQAFFATVQRSEILRISTAWKDRKNEAEDIWRMLELTIRQLLRRRLGQRDAMLPAGVSECWKRFSENAEPERFTLLLDAVAEARRQTMAAVNFQAVVEQLLFSFMGEGNRWQA